MHAHLQLRSSNCRPDSSMTEESQGLSNVPTLLCCASDAQGRAPITEPPCDAHGRDPLTADRRIAWTGARRGSSVRCTRAVRIARVARLGQLSCDGRGPCTSHELPPDTNVLNSFGICTQRLQKPQLKYKFGKMDKGHKIAVVNRCE